MTGIPKGQGLYRNMISYAGLTLVAINAALIVATLTARLLERWWPSDGDRNG